MRGRQEQLGEEKLQENTQRTRQRGEWLLKYINTGILTRNVILRVTVFLILRVTCTKTHVPLLPRIAREILLRTGSHKRTRPHEDGSQCPTSGLYLLADAVPQIWH